ncbi:rhodopsin-like [Littorina saxatilis]|uniref:G-protein coupled receptors family 1 profile domain-containing protein n=1 Tax=Littorina saxatilis TaxID=31220 RepID=A0AAN9BSQ0_9CAEN
MTTAIATTAASISNTTHIYDTYDLFIHPHWKQFPLVPVIWHYAIGVFITFVGISGTFGNLLVIYIFGTTKNLRTPSNMFVVNLALSDLTFSAVNGFPLLTISAFNRRWIFGKVACELYGLVGAIFGLMSINTMAAIAMDRYNVIARPIQASRSLSYRKAFMMIVLVWIWSITWSIPPLFGWGAYIPEGFQTSCTFDYLTRNDYFRSYIMCLYICGFALPLSIILYSYFFIYRAVAVHEKEMGKMAKKLNAEIRQGQAAQKAEIKTAKIAMTIIMTYLLSWTPYATIALIAQFGPAEWVTPYVSELPVMFAKASAMHNPIIYALSHPRFREVLNKRFPWLLCCCSYTQRESASVVESKSKVSRMDSVNSNCVGGAVSNMSEVSDLSDSVYTSNVGDGGGRHVSMKMRGMQEQQGENPENNGALIRDILQAFVGVVNSQGQRQVPVYIPPGYLQQYAAGQAPGAAGQAPSAAAQQAIYAISQGAVPADVLPNPPQVPAAAPAPVAAAPAPVAAAPAPVAAAPAPVPAAPAPVAAAPAPVPAAPATSSVPPPAPTTPKAEPAVPAEVAAPDGAQVTTQAEVNAHDNQAYQED